MTHPVYTNQSLSSLKRPQLWTICDQLGLPKYSASAKCVEAILAVQPQKVADVLKDVDNGSDNESAITSNQAAEAHIQQPFTCGDCPNFKPHNDGTNNGWCSLFDHFAVAHHALTSDCTNTMQSDAVEMTAEVETVSSCTELLPSGQAREERAAAIEVVEVHDEEFVTRNQENNNHYVVRPNQPVASERCECADAHFRGAKCKHQIAVDNFLAQNSGYTLKLNTALTQDQDQEQFFCGYEHIKLEDVFTGDRIIINGAELEVQYSRDAEKEGYVEVIVKDQGVGRSITHPADIVVQKRVPPPAPSTVKKRIDHVVVGDGVYRNWGTWEIYKIQVEEYQTRQFRNSFYTSRFILHLIDAEALKQGVWKKDVMAVFAQDVVEVLDF